MNRGEAASFRSGRISGRYWKTVYTRSDQICLSLSNKLKQKFRGTDRGVRKGHMFGIADVLMSGTELQNFSLAFWKDTIVFVIISLLIARNVSSIVL